MKILEKSLFAGILIAIALISLSILAGSNLLLLSTLLLAAIYYPLGFLFFNHIRLRDVFKKDALKNLSASKIVYGLATGLGLSIICVGSLFKILHLSGSKEMLTVGTIVTAFILLIELKKILIDKEEKNWFVLNRLLTGFTFGLIIYITPELYLIQFQYRKYPDYINAYEQYLKDPQNKSLQNKREREYKKMVLSKEEFEKYENSIQQDSIK